MAPGKRSKTPEKSEPGLVAVMRGHLAPEPLLRRADSDSSRSSDVVSGSTSPNTAARRRRRCHSVSAAGWSSVAPPSGGSALTRRGRSRPRSPRRSGWARRSAWESGRESTSGQGQGWLGTRALRRGDRLGAQPLAEWLVVDHLLPQPLGVRSPHQAVGIGLVGVPRNRDEPDVVQADVLELAGQVGDLLHRPQARCRWSASWSPRRRNPISAGGVGQGAGRHRLVGHRRDERLLALHPADVAVAGRSRGAPARSRAPPCP